MNSIYKANRKDLIRLTSTLIDLVHDLREIANEKEGETQLKKFLFHVENVCRLNNVHYMIKETNHNKDTKS
ncbi:MAG: hypothetical protein ACTSRT_03340 [Promethearchaeota archaeon]